MKPENKRLSEELNRHKADNTKHLPSGGTVGQIVQRQSEGWGLVDLPPSKDVDNGRYQADWNLEGSVLNSVILNNNIASLPSYGNDNISTPNTSPAMYQIGTSSQTIGIQLRILPATTDKIKCISQIYLKFKKYNTTSAMSITVKAYDTDLSALLETRTLANSDITDDSFIPIPFSNLTDVTGKTITFVVESVATTYQNNYYSIYLSGDKMDGIEGRDTNGQGSLLGSLPEFIMTVVGYKALTGTITKIVTPSDLKKWGNVKWTQTTPASGSTVTCDVFDCGSSITDIAPTMTSNSLPSGVVSASSYQTGYDPYKAFDKNTSTKWVANSTSASAYIQYQFSSAKMMGGFSFSTITDLSSYSSVPVTVRGSNDGNNWTDLYTFNCNLPANTKKYFIVGSLKAFTYFRFICTANFGGYFEAREIEIFESIQLKSNIQSLQDLSDIDITQYPRLALRWTLSRNSAEDVSPTISDFSVTWEGEDENTSFQDKFVIDVTSPVSQVNFDLSKLVGKYRYFNLICEAFSTGTTSSYDTLMINFNDDLSANYDLAGTSGKSYISADSMLPHSDLNNIGTANIVITDTLNKYKNLFGYLIQTTGIANVNGHWRNTNSNINKISLKTGSNSFGIGSQFTLIGVK